MPKGENIHTAEATEALSAFKAAALIVLDQGSRGGPAILPGVPTLILDHHQSTEFPDEAQASAAHCTYVVNIKLIPLNGSGKCFHV